MKTDRNILYPVAKYKDIITYICEHLGLSTEDILGKKRHDHLKYVRHCLIYLLKKEFALSTQHIGFIFSEREHATASHSYRLVLDTLTSNNYKDPIIVKTWNEIYKFYKDYENNKTEQGS